MLSDAKKDAMGLINWGEFRLNFSNYDEWRLEMKTDIERRLHRRFMSISNKILDFASAYATSLRSGPVVELNSIAVEVASLETKLSEHLENEGDECPLCAAEAQVARLNAEKSEMECVMDEVAHSLHHALSALEALDA